jgi:hypothetical protein
MVFDDLVSSDVAEDATPEWVAGTTYATDDLVKVSYGEAGVVRVAPVKIYKSLADTNVGNYPGTSPENWIETTVTNRWKMFDAFTITQTEKLESISVRVKTDKCDTIAVINAESQTVLANTYDSSENLIGTTDQYIENSFLPITNWADYFSQDFTYNHNTLCSFPVYQASQTEITLTRSTGLIAKCGTCLAGRVYYIGKTQTEPKIGITDYSRKETNDFGYTYLKQGNFTKRIEFDVMVDNTSLNLVFSLFAALRSIPTIWEANNDGTDYDLLFAYGFLKDFEIVLRGSKRTLMSVEIEGLL